MGKNKSLNDYMEDCRLIIWNAYDDETIRARLLPFGFTEEKHMANRALFGEISKLISKNEQDHADWRSASEVFKNAVEASKKSLQKIKQRLKYWYEADTPEAVSLNLYGDKTNRYADFKQSGESFYTKLLTMDEVMARLVPFGYTNESVTESKEELLALDHLRNKREQESGDAQYAIKERNAKVDKLDECVSDIVRLARLIFQDDEAQYLEKLGLIIRS